MSPEARIRLWWLLFGGTHVLGSSVPVRTALMNRLGIRGFKSVYSLVSLATFVPLCWVYFTHKHAGALVFRPDPALRSLTEWLMFLAFVVLLQALRTPNPMTTEAEMSGHYPRQPQGIQRVTRHPMNFAFATFGVAHMLSNAFVGDWVFFGGVVVYALVSAVHQDRRTLASGREEIADFQAVTSLVPFAALATGKQRLVLAEFRAGAFVVAVAVAGALWYFHSSLLGGYAG